MRLVISAAARSDLKAIARYTERKWTAAQAKTFLALISAHLAQLRRRPRMGAPRDAIAPGFRSLPAGRPLIFYRIARGAVIIVRVLHQSMDAPLHL